MPQICPTCGQPFNDPKHPNRIYCSNECRIEAHRKTVICPKCGKTFRTTLKKSRKYCSVKCARSHTHPPKSPVTWQTFNCQHCGKTFEAWVYRKRRYCSRECQKAAQYEPDAHITKTCVVCGKQYSVIRFFATKRSSRYCSNECKAQANSIIKRGAGNANYRGGTVSYRGANWGRQRRKALKRDNYVCQVCQYQGKPGQREMHVHHIRPYRKFGGDYKAANDLSNLVTLCRVCHSKVEFGDTLCPKPLSEHT